MGTQPPSIQVESGASLVGPLFTCSGFSYPDPGTLSDPFGLVMRGPQRLVKLRRTSWPLSPNRRPSAGRAPPNERLEGDGRTPFRRSRIRVVYFSDYSV